MSRYNLIDEPWIPVRDLSGDLKELGILDVLTSAEDLATIEDPSPLVTAALYRFLLAVLYRALEGPCDIDEAKKLFRDGLPKEKIRKYLETWKKRFNLFDEKYPFGQNPNISADELEPWTKLTPECNATSNKVLFDHTDTKNPGERTPAECSRGLLSLMSFSVSGGRGYFPSPSPNAVVCIPMGRNLRDTLLYMLVPQNREVTRNDRALWEKELPLLPLTIQKRKATGYADLFTWPARFVLFNQAPSGNVASLRFISGEGFDKSCGLLDPMQAFRKDDQNGLLPIQFKERGFWRDFQSLLPDTEELAPRVIQNAIDLARSERNRMPDSVIVLGLRNEPPSANLEFWRMERFVLPEAVAGDRYIRNDIHNYLEVAEDTGKSLRSACNSFGQHVVSHGDRLPDPKDVRKFVEQLLSLPHYWSILEGKFHEVLRDYTLDKDSDDIHRNWLVAVRTAFSSAWNLQRHSIAGGDAWGIRALVKAEDIIAKTIMDLNEKIKSLKEVS